MLKMAFSETSRFFGLNFKTLLFAILVIPGFVLLYYVLGREAVVEEIWIRVLLGFSPFGILALLMFFWNMARASVLVPTMQQRRYATPRDIEKGLLDFQYEGPIALKEMNKIFAKFTRETERFTPQLAKYTERFKKAGGNIKRQRKIASQAASSINRLTKEIQQQNSKLGERVNDFRNSYLGIIGWVDTHEGITHATYDLIENMMTPFKISVDQAVSGILAMQNGVKTLHEQNISSDVNAACRELTHALEYLIDTTNNISQTADDAISRAHAAMQ